MKIAKYLIAVLGLLALITRTAKADTFVYEVTTSNPFTDILDVTFDLPSFQEYVDTTTFTEATSSLGPITEFVLSGDSTDCTLVGHTVGGPCLEGEVNPTTVLAQSGGQVPAFTGPGTFVVTFGPFTTTVTITDVPSAAPEPSSLALIPLGLGALLLIRKRMIHPLAV